MNPINNNKGASFIKHEPQNSRKAPVKFEINAQNTIFTKSKKLLNFIASAANRTSPITIEIPQLPTVTNGTNGDDILRGSAQDDLIRGKKGSDTIYTGSGNDRAFGGKGNDTFYISQGNNVIHGGKGQDQVIFIGSKEDFSIEKKGRKTIVTNTVTGEINKLISIESISFKELTIQPAVVIAKETSATTVPTAIELIGDARADNATPLTENSNWILQITALFNTAELPQLADASVTVMVKNANADLLKNAITEQLEKGDYELGHNLYQALDNPLYPRNRSLIPEVHLANFINYIKNVVSAEDLKSAIIDNLPKETTEPFFQGPINIADLAR